MYVELPLPLSFQHLCISRPYANIIIGDESLRDHMTASASQSFQTLPFGLKWSGCDVGMEA